MKFWVNKTAAYKGMGSLTDSAEKSGGKEKKSPEHA